MLTHDDFHIGNNWSCTKRELKNLIIMFVLLIMSIISMMLSHDEKLNYIYTRIIMVLLVIMLIYDVLTYRKNI